MVAFQRSHYLTAIALGGVALIGHRIYQWSLSRRNVANINPSWAKYRIKPSTLSKRQLEDLDRRRPPREWNTVIIFRSPLDPERPDPFNQLRNYFEAAKVSLHICIYSLSLCELSNLIYRKCAEGVEVVIITDYAKWIDTAQDGEMSELKMLSGYGIDVRVHMGTSRMHHNFAIIDEEAVLAGSLDWTNQGVWNSNGHVMVTTDPRITAKFVQQFRRLWVDTKDVGELDYFNQVG